MAVFHHGILRFIMEVTETGRTWSATGKSVYIVPDCLVFRVGSEINSKLMLFMSFPVWKVRLLFLVFTWSPIHHNMNIIFAFFLLLTTFLDYCGL